jgi:hypothetical protein
MQTKTDRKDIPKAGIDFDKRDTKETQRKEIIEQKKIIRELRNQVSNVTSSVIPKLASAEIKQRLINMKFYHECQASELQQIINMLSLMQAHNKETEINQKEEKHG